MVALAASCSPPPEGFDDCRQRFASGRTDYDCCRCFYDVGRATGDWDTAERQLGELIEAEERSPGAVSTRLAWLEFYRARIALDGRQDNAQTRLERAIELFETTAEPLGEVHSRINLSRHHEARGELPEALEQLELAAAAAERTADPGLVAQTTLQHLRLRVELEADLRTVLLDVRQLESRFYDTGPHSFKRDALFLRGRLSYELGEYDEARTAYEAGTRLCEEAEDPFGESAFRLNLANLLVARGRPADREPAMASFRAVVALARETGNTTAEAKARLALARLGDGDGGHLERALELATAAEDPAVEAEALLARAVRLRESDPQGAAAALRAGEAAAERSGSPWTPLYGWTERLTVLWATRPPAEALEASLVVLDSIERLRQLQRASSGRAQLLAPWTEVYRWLGGMLLAEGGEQARSRALAISERMRARVLLDRLEATGAEPGSERAPPPILEVLEEIVGVNRSLLSHSLTAAERRLVVERLAALESRLERLESATGWEPPAGLEEVDAGRLARSLAQNEALLSFQLAPWENIHGEFAGGAWLVVLTSAASRSYRLPGRFELEDRMRIVQGLFAEGGPVAAVARRQLYDQLLAEALAELPERVDRLIVVPDGPLHRFGLAALEAGPGEPLIARYSLAQVPSAALWHRLRLGTERRARLPALAIADPVTGGGGEAAARGWWEGGLELGRLPHAAGEGRAMARVLGSGSRAVVGAEASEELVKRDAARYGWLHFGAHAVVDERHPERSGIVLSAGSAGQDGLLQAREIRQLPLAGRVVVLASCHSAAGEPLEGEGPLSLARSFFAAGARTVVASLWEVGDQASARLFGEFYPAIARGEPVDRALALAQRRLAGDGHPPSDWAGFVVLGDGG